MQMAMASIEAMCHHQYPDKYKKPQRTGISHGIMAKKVHNPPAKKWANEQCTVDWRCVLELSWIIAMKNGGRGFMDSEWVNYLWLRAVGILTPIFHVLSRKRLRFGWSTVTTDTFYDKCPLSC